MYDVSYHYDDDKQQKSNLVIMVLLRERLLFDIRQEPNRKRHWQRKAGSLTMTKLTITPDF